MIAWLCACGRSPYAEGVCGGFHGIRNRRTHNNVRFMCSVCLCRNGVPCEYIVTANKRIGYTLTIVLSLTRWTNITTWTLFTITTMMSVKWVSGKLRYIIGLRRVYVDRHALYRETTPPTPVSRRQLFAEPSVYSQLLFLLFHQQQLDVWAYLYSSSETAAAHAVVEGSCWQPQLCKPFARVMQLHWRPLTRPPTCFSSLSWVLILHMQAISTLHVRPTCTAVCKPARFSFFYANCWTLVYNIASVSGKC